MPRPCRSCGAELPPEAAFCDACGTPAERPTVPAAGRRLVSVVFGDLVGSTALQERLDPESVRAVMSRFYDTMRATVSRHGGQLEKLLGDGVVAVFGVPVAGEDDALRAVRCAAGMVEDLAVLGDELEPRWGLRLHLRAGVNTGEVVISGDGELVGDAMNTAARLQESGASGQVVLGEATWRLVRHRVRLEPMAALALRGKAAPVRAWRLLSAEPEPGDAGEGRLEAPFVGRVEELARLRAAYDEVTEARAGRLVTVVGSPGVGKSRLAARFALTVEDEATVLHGRCEPIGEGLTFLPIAHLLREAAGIGETDPVAEVTAKLAALVGDDPDAERVVTLASSLLGAAEPASAEETFWGVRSVLEALARRRPLLVVLDDVHWGQPMFLDLVEHLVEWVRDVPLLVVLLARPELREMRDVLTTRGRRTRDVIELGSLGPGESLKFVEGLLGPIEHLPVGLWGRILDTTDGNPLFLGETMRMLVDDGVLNPGGDQPPCAEPWSVHVPPTVQALLSARIERLTPQEREVIQRAAVIGKQFYPGAVAQLVGWSQGIDAQLHALRRKEMVEPAGTYWVDEPVYRFHNMLIRDAAYRSLLKQTRADLHERFAGWLTAKAGDRLADHELIVAYHLEQAHRQLRELGSSEHGRELGRRAATTLHTTAGHAFARGDMAAAAALLGRALECRDADDPELLWDLADAFLNSGDVAGVNDTVGRLAAVAGDDAGLRARTEVLSEHLAVLTGRTAPDAAIAALTRAAETLGAAGDDIGVVDAHRVAARRYRQQGRFGAAEAALDHALTAARRAGDQRRITAVLAAGPRTTLWGPTPVARASGRCLDALRIMRRTPGNRHVEPIALRCQAVLEAMRGRFDAARALLTAAGDTLHELGQTLELQELAISAGIVELLAGDPGAAGKHLERAHEEFVALGVGIPAARAAALLARALADQGRDDEALEHAGYAEEHAADDLKTVVTWCGVRATVLARRGRAEEAIALARRAVRRVEPTDALADRADAALTLARVLHAAGRAEEAGPAVKRAREWYAAKGHTVGIGWTGEFAATPGPARHRLTAALVTLGDQAPGRFVAEFIRRWAEGDLDAVVELYAEDWRLVDHRDGGLGRLRGRDRARELVAGLLATLPDTHRQVTGKLDGDDRVLAATATLATAEADTDGSEVGFVLVVESGRLLELHLFAAEDRERIRAEYARLGGRPAALGDRPPERAAAAFCRPWTVGDVDELVELFPPDVVLVDRRSLGDEVVHGRDQLRASYLANLATLGSLHVRPDQVLACDDRVLAMRTTMRGSGRDGAGEFVTAANYVCVVEQGRITRFEHFEGTDTAGALARYDELGGSREGLGGRQPERLFAEVVRRSSIGENVRELFRPDFAMVDHRRLGWAEVDGPESAAELLRSVFSMAPDMHVEIDEVLACDDQVMALAFTGHGTAADGGGPLALPLGYVLAARDERLARIEVYEPEERAAMVARYAQLGGGQGPLGDRIPERLWAEYVRLQAAGDLDAIAELIAEDSVLVDHRSLGWREMRGRTEVMRRLRSGHDVVTDLRLDIDEVLACDDRVIAMRTTGHGTRRGGAGVFYLPVGIVSEVVDGRIARREQFDYDDTAGMLDRFAELGTAK
jgi:class 3 adenylate cyclase/tetratricopeptide (TPR) repeat protein/ketosteroid isomerase-like protein